MSSLPWTPAKIAWISGVSAVGRAELTEIQLAFVDSMPGPRGWKLRTNFPYSAVPPDAPQEGAPVKKANLLWASAINTGRFLAACQPLHRPSRLDAWSAVKASCETLLLVSLSCGSQIAQSMESRRPKGARVKMLSFGPTDFGCSAIDRRVILGTEDRVSRSPDLRDAATLEGVGHLDYTTSKKAGAAAAEWLEQELKSLGMAP